MNIQLITTDTKWGQINCVISRHDWNTPTGIMMPRDFDPILREYSDYIEESAYLATDLLPL